MKASPSALWHSPCCFSCAGAPPFPAASSSSWQELPSRSCSTFKVGASPSSARSILPAYGPTHFRCRSMMSRMLPASRRHSSSSSLRNHGAPSEAFRFAMAKLSIPIANSEHSGLPISPAPPCRACRLVRVFPQAQQARRLGRKAGLPLPSPQSALRSSACSPPAGSLSSREQSLPP
ncbi:hypothetical protein D3C80_1236830 [compost metagenome]